MNPRLICDRHNVVDYMHQHGWEISIVILLTFSKHFLEVRRSLNLSANQKRLTVQPQFLLEWTKSLANCGRQRLCLTNIQTPSTNLLTNHASGRLLAPLSLVIRPDYWWQLLPVVGGQDFGVKTVQYMNDNLYVPANTSSEDEDLILSIIPQDAGWELISFQARRLNQGQSWSFACGQNELVIVNLSGTYTIEANCGRWTNFGDRENVFQGAGSALYLPRRSEFTIMAETGGEYAIAWVPTDQDNSPWLITSNQVPVSVRGGDNVSRQINDLLPPGSPVHRLVLVEVYTPSGNWSSYPPHKHDVHIEGKDGTLIEADLEEVYFYKIDKSEGYAYQRVYTDHNSPLHQAGKPIDALIRAEDNSAVLVPEGYHPVVSAPGYTTYYLNVLAGSAQSLANQDDPNFSWVKDTYQQVDPRLPLYSIQS